MPKILRKRQVIFKGKYRNMASLNQEGREGICLVFMKTLESTYLILFHPLSATESCYSKEQISVLGKFGLQIKEIPTFVSKWVLADLSKWIEGGNTDGFYKGTLSAITCLSKQIVLSK